MMMMNTVLTEELTSRTHNSNRPVVSAVTVVIGGRVGSGVDEEVESVISPQVTVMVASCGEVPAVRVEIARDQEVLVDMQVDERIEEGERNAEAIIGLSDQDVSLSLSLSLSRLLIPDNYYRYRIAHVHACVRAYGCVCVCKCARTRVCVCACVHTGARVCICVCMRALYTE